MPIHPDPLQRRRQALERRSTKKSKHGHRKGQEPKERTERYSLRHEGYLSSQKTTTLNMLMLERQTMLVLT